MLWHRLVLLVGGDVSEKNTAPKPSVSTYQTTRYRNYEYQSMSPEYFLSPKLGFSVGFVHQILFWHTNNIGQRGRRVTNLVHLLTCVFLLLQKLNLA